MTDNIKLQCVCGTMRKHTIYRRGKETEENWNTNREGIHCERMERSFVKWDGNDFRDLGSIAHPQEETQTLYLPLFRTGKVTDIIDMRFGGYISM